MGYLKAAALTAGLAVAYGLTAPGAEAQRSGAEIWRSTCGSCHTLQPPGRYTAKDWQAIGTHMVIQARLTTAQGNAVLEFLRQGARETTAAAVPQAPGSRRSASRAEPVMDPAGDSVGSSATDRVKRYLQQIRSEEGPELAGDGTR